MSLELPQAKEITRDELAAPDFNVPAFLLAHTEFQSLTDLRDQISSWEQRLKRELTATVNEQYGDFLKSEQIISGGTEALENVRLEVLKFKKDALSTSQSLSQLAGQIDMSIEDQRKLCARQAEARALLVFIDELAAVEDNLDALEQENSRDGNDRQLVDRLVSLAKRTFALGQIASSHKDVVLVRNAKERVNEARKRTLDLLTSSIEQCSDSPRIFDLVVAKSWLYRTGKATSPRRA